MGNKKNENAQPSLDNEQADQADKIMNVIEAGLLNKQQELKKLEDSLTQKETFIVQREQALKAAKDAIAQKEAELNDKRVQLEEMELQAKNGFPQLFEEKFASFKKQRPSPLLSCFVPDRVKKRSNTSFILPIGSPIDFGESIDHISGVLPLKKYSVYPLLKLFSRLGVNV